MVLKALTCPPSLESCKFRDPVEVDVGLALASGLVFSRRSLRKLRVWTRVGPSSLSRASFSIFVLVRRFVQHDYSSLFSRTRGVCSRSIIVEICSRFTLKERSLMFHTRYQPNTCIVAPTKSGCWTLLKMLSRMITKWVWMWTLVCEHNRCCRWNFNMGYRECTYYVQRRVYSMYSCIRQLLFVRAIRFH